MKTRKLLTTLAIFAVVLIAGCKEDDFVGVVSDCPAVLSTSPASNATGVPLDKIITATFNEAMNPLTITPESFSLDDGAKKKVSQVSIGLKGAIGSSAMILQGALTYDGDTYTMSFNPSNLLAASTTYTATILSSVKDISGNALQADYVWTFSTGTTLSPTVISTDPTDNATDVFLTKVVKATFSVPMNPTTFTSTTFTLKQGATSIPGTVTYSGSTASFKSTTNLISNTLYTATITNEVKNVSGTFMKDDYEWSFTTGTIVTPTIISTDPLNLATGVARNKVISANFSEAMNAATLTTSTFTLMNGATPVIGVVNYSGTTATFTPNADLISGVTYTATVTTGAMNPTGTPLANDYEWSFSTVLPLGPLVVDLNSVARFGIIAGVGVSNDAGFSEIHNLDVGIYPGVRSSIVGFPPAIIVNGAMYAADDIAPPGVPAMLIQAKDDLVAAYLFAEGATSPAPATVAGDLGGTTLAPGIYKSTSTLLIQSGNLTLDAQGDENAIWIFQIASDFTTVGGSPYPSPAGGNVILAGSAQAKNVFWQVGSSVTIGDYTSFKGNILALTTITMNAYSQAEGRMLARNGSVTMTSTNIISKP
ncbi:MAG: DUF3494 domain-containing protein [Bacteroidales bacterium]|nr:MAG: DUF3494 domain-containing protein [Bacteroidales bacterium]